MVIYVILIMIAICSGMAISVYAFGTGGKRKNIFKDIYYSIEDIDGMGVLYTKNGDYSAIISIENPVQQYSADIESYYDYNRLFTAIVQTLGEGYALHKQDIFVRRPYGKDNKKREFLSEAYFDYFSKRTFTEMRTYITITQENKKSSLFAYDNKKWNDFLVKVRKVTDHLQGAGVPVKVLSKQEASNYVDRYFSMDFSKVHPSFNNITVSEEQIAMGNRNLRAYSIVDIDQIAMPSQLQPFTTIEMNNTTLPVDIMSQLDKIPYADTVVFNQIIYIPNQRKELNALEKKKNRHSSLPSPSNLIAVEDIKKVQEVIARESKQLVYTHYNLLLTCPSDVDLQGPTNHLENMFGKLGIHISKQSYNQLELFVNSFPGNCFSMSQEYDRFLTLSDAAMCLMFKERIQHSEDTPLQIFYTDRQGVPVAIDITGKEGAEKLTDNSNFFCLGPSGSGKSFHMNSVVRQLWEQNTDVVMVDTGNSYEGLCEYVGGKYISYTDENPITMNPFKVKKEDLNIEKINFLKNLILQIWLGSQDVPTRTETAVVEQIIDEYYSCYFDGPRGYTSAQRNDIKKGMLTELQNKSLESILKDMGNEDDNYETKIDCLLDDLDERRKMLTVPSLSFNTFYEFAVEDIAIICTEKCIPNVSGVGIRPSDFRTSIQAFYEGGRYEKTLNEDADSSLFDQTFIVFEIDTIKDDPVLFPIVTLIIMDVFLQKMRIKKNRKVLVIEEAWKAIATPLMAEYIKYLYKTARKFWASVGVVTQELQDIIGSAIVKEAIINNSDVTMLLDQNKFKERFDEIKSILGLTDIDCKKIFTINRLDNKEGRSFFREVFIRRGLNSGVFGVEEPRECYMTYTTERAEKEALKLYKSELGCTHQEAIERYVKDWEKSGIDKSLAFAKKVNSTGHVLNL